MNLNIIKCYNEEHRKYHTLRHITKMLENVIFFNLNEDNLVKINLAILYHDIRYVPLSTTNESNSAKKFTNDCFKEIVIVEEEIFRNKEAIKHINTMILDTKNHVPTIELSKVLIDLDLWDLANYELYLSGSDLVEQEYSPRFCSKKEYIIGRIKWINRMLNKKQIFYTDYCIDHNFNERAKSHLRLDLQHLKNRK